jgi:hypothetical protein
MFELHPFQSFLVIVTIGIWAITIALAIYYFLDFKKNLKDFANKEDFFQ